MYCYHPKIFRGKEREWLLKPGRKGDDQALEREGCVEGTTLRSTIILDWRSQPVQVHPAERRLGNIYPQPHSPSRHSPTVALHWLNPDSSQRAREITGSVCPHQISSCFSTIWWKDCPFFQCFCFLCWKSNKPISLGLFFFSVFCPVGIFIDPYLSTTLFWKL